jgi:hypothetical protein
VGEKWGTMGRPGSYRRGVREGLEGGGGGRGATPSTSGGW